MNTYNLSTLVLLLELGRNFNTNDSIINKNFEITNDNNLKFVFTLNLN